MKPWRCFSCSSLIASMRGIEAIKPGPWPFRFKLQEGLERNLCHHCCSRLDAVLFVLFTFSFAFELNSFLSVLEQVSFVKCQEHSHPQWPASLLFLSSLPPFLRQSSAVGGVAISSRIQRRLRGGQTTTRSKNNKMQHPAGRCHQQRHSNPMFGSSRAMLAPALRIKCGMTTPWSPVKFTKYVCPMWNHLYEGCLPMTAGDCRWRCRSCLRPRHYPGGSR